MKYIFSANFAFTYCNIAKCNKRKKCPEDSVPGILAGHDQIELEIRHENMGATGHFLEGVVLYYNDKNESD